MFDNPDEAFAELDKKPFWDVAKSLAGYRKALMDQGFNRREACRLVELYAKFIYESAVDAMIDRGLPEPPEEDDNNWAAWSSLVAREAHNLEVMSSNLIVAMTRPKT